MRSQEKEWRSMNRMMKELYRCIMPGCLFNTDNILNAAQHTRRTRDSREGAHQIKGRWDVRKDEEIL